MENTEVDRQFKESLSKGNSEDIFRFIYKQNIWGGEKSVSGTGSESKQITKIVREVPNLIKKYKISSLLDVPCGDFHWMSKIDLSDINYIGGDILEEIINESNKNYARDNMEFVLIDITRDDLPNSDMLLCRDCLGHFSLDLIDKTLKNICKSNIHYLLTTSFPNTEINQDIKTGLWRPVNLETSPFNLDRTDIIYEECSEAGEQYSDKSLILVDLWTS